MFRYAPAFAALAAGALLLGACHHRQCGWRASPEEKADKAVKRIASHLDLDEAQRARLDGIKNDLLARKADFAALKEGLPALVLGQVRAAEVDTAALNRDLESREAKARELRGLVVAKLAEFHAVLSPAQREKLAAHIESHLGACR
jgi:Spy/CpxP family protein refolding chaperone